MNGSDCELEAAADTLVKLARSKSKENKELLTQVVLLSNKLSQSELRVAQLQCQVNHLQDNEAQSRKIKILEQELGLGFIHTLRP